MVDARSQMVRWLAALGATVRQTFALRRRNTARPGDFGRSILKQACMFVEYCANEKLRKVAFAFPPQRAPRGGPPSGATLSAGTGAGAKWSSSSCGRTTCRIRRGADGAHAPRLNVKAADISTEPARPCWPSSPGRLAA